MRKELLAIAVAILMMPFSANAQWWLFPGSPQQKNGTEVPDTLKSRPETSPATEEVPGTVTDTLKALLPADTFEYDMPDVINVSLLLPLKSDTQKPSANFIEYYCGALMAVRDLGLKGTKVNLSVFDIAGGLGRITPDVLSASDVIIGPVSPQDIESLHAMLPEDKYIVSPIEPKTAGMADSMRVIQAPVPWTEQTDRLVEWAGSELSAHDAVILLKDNSEGTPSEQTDYLIRKLEESGIDFKTVYSTTFEGLKLAGTVRFFLASDRDLFLCSAINNIANMVSRRGEGSAVLYSTSKIRSLEGMNAVSPHIASARITSAYNIDYDNPDIQDFVRSYRSLFKSEPASFAFSGYDTVTYFTGICAKYGRQWPKKLDMYTGHGLQADFKFDSCDGTGTVNTAVRRVLYTPDLSMLLLQ